MSRFSWLIVGLLFIGKASAAEADRGFYLGAGFGKAELTLEDSNSFADFEGDDLGVRVLGGYRFFRHFAVEASYADYGDAQDSIAGVDLTGSFSAFALSAVGLIPLNSFDLFGKLGFGAWEGELTPRRSGGGFVEDNVDPLVGFGIQVRSGNLTVRGEVEAQLLGFDNDNDGEADGDDLVSLLSLSLMWNF